MLVEIEGVTDSGGFAPVILPTRITILGVAPLPAPTLVSFSELQTGVYDAQPVQIRAIVERTETPDRLILGTPDGRFIGRLIRAERTDLAAFRGAEVRITGVCHSYFNSRGELAGHQLVIRGPGDIVVEKVAPNPFSAPLVPLHALRPFSSTFSGLLTRRVVGTVTFSLPGQFFYLQEGQHGIRINSHQVPAPSVGDRVEVAGIARHGASFAELTEAIFRKAGTAPLPQPVVTNRVSILEHPPEDQWTGFLIHDGLLVQIDGVLDRVEQAGKNDVRLHIEHRDRVLTATLAAADVRLVRERFPPGSKVRVTGVCLVQLSTQIPALDYPRPAEFQLLLRSPSDVEVVQAAPWWTPEKLFIALGASGLVLLLASAWVWILRRRVEQRTTELALEIQARHDAAGEFAAILHERERLAADLHDTMGQGLVALALQIEAAEALQAQAPASSARHFHLARHLLTRTREDLHRSVWNLRAGALHDRTLPEAMREVFARCCDGESLRIQVDEEGDWTNVPDFVSGSILLLAQEVVTNAVKHAQAEHITVRACCAASDITISIADDGRGFDLDQPFHIHEGHFGLQGMRERVKRLGGKLQIESAPGKGTRVTAQIPWKTPQQISSKNETLPSLP